MYKIPVELYEKINPIIQEPLAYNDIDKLKKQLSNLQSIRYELAYKRCEWYKKLLDSKEKVRVPKDKGYTELDRATMMGAATSVIAQDYEFLLGLEKIVETQIELGITFLQTS